MQYSIYIIQKFAKSKTAVQESKTASLVTENDRSLPVARFHYCTSAYLLALGVDTSKGM
jgi:hypothetical protein